MESFQFSGADIASLPERVRARLVNSLSGFKAATLVGTIDLEGRTNLAIVNSVFHLGANPALMGMIIRPASVPRHTFENIKATRVYTFNHVSAEMVARAHHTSARFAKEESEFEKCGFKTSYHGEFKAPFVAEASLRIGLSLQEIVHLAINQTELVIGKIEWLEIPAGALLSDGHVDLEAAGTVAVTGLDSYHQTRQLARYAYAKPDRPPRALPSVDPIINVKQLWEQKD